MLPSRYPSSTTHRHEGVLAFFIGAQDRDMSVVQIPPVHRVSDPKNFYELDLSEWGLFSLPDDEVVLCLEDYQKLVDQHPPRSGISLTHQYRICWQSKQRWARQHSDLIKRLSGGAIEECPGNMIVVKEDHDGIPRDVHEAELALVANIVV
ncbi:hypothetical protein CVT26_011230 [Gymnopilus dilepis]|uniref:Uncharacterized protein n=1 Tax=Gymnopilus dilepis TaxID=231916 RepID=A0A409WRF6_9AGAR|nr:hypothetical protein CVT26_011230 [Gymnopilus dilepis]